MGDNIIWFDAIEMDDISVVGGKNASLGVLTRELASEGIRVPAGFALTTSAYRAFLAANHIEPAMRRAIERFRSGKANLERTGQAIRERILAGAMPEAVTVDLVAGYTELGHRLKVRSPVVAVRSSATAEDLPGASFAGQFESFLNIRGDDALIEACRRCFASLFTDRAIAYREAKGFDHLAVALSIGVQQMVRSDRAGYQGF